MTRRSGTLASEMVYHAVKLPSGSVLRLAATQRTVWGRLMGYLPWIALLLAACLALSALVSRVSTRRLLAPITLLDLEHPLDNDCYAELSPLLKRLYEQQQAGEAQLETLREQKEKTDALLSNMREGLVVLNRNERILSLNGAARRILGLEGRDCAGHTLLELNRSAALQALLSEARGASGASGALELGSRHYHVNLSRVGADEGYLLLMQDDTAESEAEAMRRQFTANVSHELRTPLTAIGGYAEMLENGMVARDDEQAFVGRIRSESARMLTLVEDILRLSQLDEGSVSLSMREADLKAVAEETVKSLESKAQARSVSLAVMGESVKLTTDVTLLHEVMTNLVDNAVKYNREGGSVAIELGAKDGRPCFTVRDTGIGIPKEQQAKVFERFYRVDKSRSKQTGGTGLGLSIVKHAALLLHAEVSLQSELGVGTSVTVLL